MNYIGIKTKLEEELRIKEISFKLDNRATHYEIRNAIPRREKEIEELKLIIQAVVKQIPMQGHYEYDDEFICPACSFEDDGYDVKRVKVCPECGQKLKWD